jgi:hypothetical protein
VCGGVPTWCRYRNQHPTTCRRHRRFAHLHRLFIHFKLILKNDK